MYQLDKEAFGEFLQGLRKEKGLTQRQLAEALTALPEVNDVIFREDYLEVYLDRPLEENRLREKAEAAGYPVVKID